MTDHALEPRIWKDEARWRPLRPPTQVLLLITPVEPFGLHPGRLEDFETSSQEGKYVNGQWEPGRWLNGDQTHQGRHLRLPSAKFNLQRIKLYRYR